MTLAGTGRRKTRRLPSNGFPKPENRVVHPEESVMTIAARPGDDRDASS
jgi:hypothetical protein